MSDDLERDRLKVGIAAAAATGERAAVELLKLLETRRIMGDPRVRVQVPTDGESEAAPCSFSMSRRYSLD